MTQASNATGSWGALTARSVLASTLLGADQPLLPVAYLLHVAGLFGINENRARVALSRMVSSGEACAEGDGRYGLGGHLVSRRTRQKASRAGVTRPWSGSWRMVVVTTTGSSAETRASRRRVLALARLSELRDGVWLRPDNIDIELDPGMAADVVIFDATPSGDGAHLAGTLWDLAGWSATSRSLMAAMDALLPEQPSQLAAGFELSAAVLRHFQADPLLPLALLPTDWPGESLRQQYLDWDRTYRAVLAQWSRAGLGDGSTGDQTGKYLAMLRKKPV